MHWPYPRWDCEHQWKAVGQPFVVWTSTNTTELPPKYAPRLVEVVCMVCGGYHTQYVATDPTTTVDEVRK